MLRRSRAPHHEPRPHTLGSSPLRTQAPHRSVSREYHLSIAPSHRLRRSCPDSRPSVSAGFSDHLTPMPAAAPRQQSRWMQKSSSNSPPYTNPHRSVSNPTTSSTYAGATRPLMPSPPAPPAVPRGRGTPMQLSALAHANPAPLRQQSHMGVELPCSSPHWPMPSPPRRQQSHVGAELSSSSPHWPNCSVLFRTAPRRQQSHVGAELSSSSPHWPNCSVLLRTTPPAVPCARSSSSPPHWPMPTPHRCASSPTWARSSQAALRTAQLLRIAPYCSVLLRIAPHRAASSPCARGTLRAAHRLSETFSDAANATWNQIQIPDLYGAGSASPTRSKRDRHQSDRLSHAAGVALIAPIDACAVAAEAPRRMVSEQSLRPAGELERVKSWSLAISAAASPAPIVTSAGPALRQRAARRARGDVPKRRDASWGPIGRHERGVRVRAGLTEHVIRPPERAREGSSPRAPGSRAVPARAPPHAPRPRRLRPRPRRLRPHPRRIRPHPRRIRPHSRRSYRPRRVARAARTACAARAARAAPAALALASLASARTICGDPIAGDGRSSESARGGPWPPSRSP